MTGALASDFASRVLPSAAALAAAAAMRRALRASVATMARVTVATASKKIHGRTVDSCAPSDEGQY